jgi:hypothetical protein
MKLIILLLAISLTCSMFAQKKLFVRVYNLHGKKVTKGRVLSVTDTTLELNEGSITETIPAQNIGTIRTKHSMGQSIFFGALAGTATGAIIAAAKVQPDNSDPNSIEVISPEVEAGALIFLGLLGGTIVGTIVGAAKDSQEFIIHGDLNKWKSFRSLVMVNNTVQKKEMAISKF